MPCHVHVKYDTWPTTLPVGCRAYGPSSMRRLNQVSYPSCRHDPTWMYGMSQYVSRKGMLKHDDFMSSALQLLKYMQCDRHMSRLQATCCQACQVHATMLVKYYATPVLCDTCRASEMHVHRLSIVNRMSDAGQQLLQSRQSDRLHAECILRAC